MSLEMQENDLGEMIKPRNPEVELQILSRGGIIDIIRLHL